MKQTNTIVIQAF